MTTTKCLIILPFVILIITSSTSCQLNRNNNTQNNTTQKSDSFRQIFWDSIPKQIGYVNDYENIYTEDEEKSLDSLIGDFEKRTTIQIAVVTLDTTMTTTDSLDALTLRIANIWGVGLKDKTNGIVIGISKVYRRMRIQNGYGIKNLLTDEETKQIIDASFIPSYHKAEYFDGTFQGLHTLMTILEKRYK